MKFSQLLYVFSAVFFSACTQIPTDTTPHKVSQYYEATGDSSGIHAYIYGKRTVIKFDNGKPYNLSIRDAEGLGVNYKMEGDYCLLKTHLDEFTIYAGSREVTFNATHPQAH